MSTTPLLEIENVTKDFKRGVRANDDISLSVAPGEVFGLLGHNGAGKTTLLSQVVGLLKPTSGAIRLDGKDAVADPDMAREVCSFQPQTQAPLDGVSPHEAIELMARIRGATKKKAQARANELLAALDIEAWADKKGDQLSGGVKRLTAFAMAAAEPGRLVMFDEPTNDVDPVRRRLLWDEIRELAATGCAVVLVTHNVIEAERAVENLAVLDQGKVVAHGTPTELRGDHRDELRLELVALNETSAIKAAAEFEGINQPVLAGRRAVVPITAANSPAAIDRARKLQESGAIEEFSITPVGLEDVYIRLVGPENDTSERTTDATLAA